MGKITPPTRTAIGKPNSPNPQRKKQLMLRDSSRTNGSGGHLYFAVGVVGGGARRAKCTEGEKAEP
jgi:hypothetical protein